MKAKRLGRPARGNRRDRCQLGRDVTEQFDEDAARAAPHLWTSFATTSVMSNVRAMRLLSPAVTP